MRTLTTEDRRRALTAGAVVAAIGTANLVVVYAIAWLVKLA